jgi:hypothetical protein
MTVAQIGVVLYVDRMPNPDVNYLEEVAHIPGIIMFN